MYDYLEAVKEDVKNYIDYGIDLKEYDSQEQMEQYLNDELFCNDSVTGNALGGGFIFVARFFSKKRTTISGSLLHLQHI